MMTRPWALYDDQTLAEVRRRAAQALEAGGARRLGNESFFSAPQLKRYPLGGA